MTVLDLILNQYPLVQVNLLNMQYLHFLSCIWLDFIVGR